MTAIDRLMISLRKKDIRFSLAGDSLHIDAPKGGLAAADIEAIRMRKSAIIEFLQRVEIGRSSERIERADRSGTLLLSWPQQQMWLLDQVEGVGAAYNIPAAIRFRGVLDIPALRRTLDTLVRRHEVLRTVFVGGDNGPWQEIAEQRHFALQTVDLSELPESQREEQVRQHAREEAGTRFNLRSGPLIRGRLLRVNVAEHVLLVTMHHIVSDGGSMMVLIREFAQLYAAYREQRDNPLEPLPIQYADYAQWQRKRLRGEVLERQLGYWREQLRGAAPVLQLPADRSRPANRSYRGADIEVVLNAQLSAQLRDLAQRHEMTLFMVLYAAWAILLSRLSGQADVVIGTPMANRPRPDLEELIGLFVNTLALRVHVRGEERIDELLEQVKKVTLGAYAHQEVPFEQVVEAIQRPRSLSYSPVFQVMFTLQSVPQNELRLPGLTLVPQGGMRNEVAKYDLTLLLTEHVDHIVGSINYAADLFDRETVEHWMECFTVVLRGLVEGSQSRVRELPLLGEPGRRQVVEVFNTTRVEYPRDRLIHELFEEQVRRSPQALAVVYEDQHLTYEELNGRANQLAHCLRQRGIGPDQVVGLCVERGLEMMVGLLGILKAGGAYLPLEPGYPPQRLQFMLADARVSVLLTQARLTDRLRESLGEHVGVMGILALDAEEEFGPQPSANVPGREFGLRPQHLGYVIYTSGSTGEPKGVMVEHATVVNLWHGLERLYREPTDCRHIAVNASVTFDASVQQWVQLLSGCTLFVIPQASRLDGRLLLRFMEQHRIEGTDCTPLQLNAWIAAGFLERGSYRPRTVLVGGEPIEAQLWCRLAHDSEVAFYNVYGPTECTVDSTVAYLSKARELPHIGRPIGNARVYVLDTQDQPTPVGVAGEICIGGAGVARGYLNRAQLTAQRFVADGISGESGARLYRTGDLGRWRADGTLEYLGRNDQQVKIRGYRIEPGEIEAALQGHAAVKQAVVLVREDHPGEKRLVGYVKGAVGEAPSTEELRSYLKERLPEYMVPAVYVVVETWPLTANGKLDRQRLPAPDQSALSRQKYEAPQGQMEEALAAIWQELLHVERVGRWDHFFDLGGHSLLAMQLTVRVRSLFSIEMAMRALFEHPTVWQLAIHVEELRQKRLIDEIACSWNEVEDLLGKVSSMSETEVHELTQELRTRRSYE
jgi:amino acid adenylation domain-containing protein